MTNKLIKKQIVILIFIGFAFSLFLISILEDGKLDKEIFGKDKMSLATVYIADIPLWVEVADSFEKRKTGLSGRESLKEDRGMLFVFDRSLKHGIWMKDMNFPIDIFWIDENNRIVDIQTNAEPESFPKIFYPKADAMYIIETISGFQRIYNINIGDRVILKVI